MSPEFRPWPKIARLNRDIVITEKIDGTAAAGAMFKVTLENDEQPKSAVAGAAQS